MSAEKDRLLELLRETLRGELEALEQTLMRTQDDADLEGKRPSCDPNDHTSEIATLALGLAGRVRDKRAVLSALTALELHDFEADDPIDVGALVTLEALEDPARRSHVFIAPRGGGMQAVLKGEKVRVVTPESPMGQALMGLYEGDDVELHTPRDGTREAVILSVA